MDDSYESFLNSGNTDNKPTKEDDSYESFLSSGKTKAKQPGLGSDLAYQATSAANAGLAGLARTVDTIFSDGKDGEFIKRLDANVEYGNEQLSDAQKEANQKTLLSDKPGEIFGEGITDPRKISGLIASGAGSLVPMLATGGPLSSLSRNAAIKLGANAGGKVAAGAGALGYGLSEAGMVGGGVSGDIQKGINDMPQEIIKDAPAYQELINSGLSDTEARGELGRKLGVEGMINSVPLSVLFGTVGGHFMNKALSGKLSGTIDDGVSAFSKEALKARGKNAASGVLAEAPTEAGQGAAEQYIKNVQLGQVNPSIQPMDDVAESGLGEGIGGAGMGAGVGAIASPQQNVPEPTLGEILNIPKGPLSRAANKAPTLELPRPNEQIEFNRERQPIQNERINFNDGSTATAQEYYQVRLANHGDSELALQETYQALNKSGQKEQLALPPKTDINLPYVNERKVNKESELINKKPERGFKQRPEQLTSELQTIKEISDDPKLNKIIDTEIKLINAGKGRDDLATRLQNPKDRITKRLTPELFEQVNNTLQQQREQVLGYESESNKLTGESGITRELNNDASSRSVSSEADARSGFDELQARYGEGSLAGSADTESSNRQRDGLQRLQGTNGSQESNRASAQDRQDTQREEQQGDYFREESRQPTHEDETGEQYISLGNGDYQDTNGEVWAFDDNELTHITQNDNEATNGRQEQQPENSIQPDEVNGNGQEQTNRPINNQDNILNEQGSKAENAQAQEEVRAEPVKLPHLDEAQSVLFNELPPERQRDSNYIKGRFGVTALQSKDIVDSVQESDTFINNEQSQETNNGDLSAVKSDSNTNLKPVIDKNTQKTGLNEKGIDINPLSNEFISKQVGDVDSYIKAVKDDFSHLLTSKEKRSGGVSNSDLADRIANTFDLNNPKNKLAYSALKNSEAVTQAKDNKRYSASSKSVRDNTQQAVIKDGVVTIINRSGRKTVSKHSFDLSEWGKLDKSFGNPSFNKREFIKSLDTVRVDNTPESHSLMDRIIDSQISAINDAYNQQLKSNESKPSQETTQQAEPSTKRIAYQFPDKTAATLWAKKNIKGDYVISNNKHDPKLHSIEFDNDGSVAPPTQWYLDPDDKPVYLSQDNADGMRGPYSKSELKKQHGFTEKQFNESKPNQKPVSTTQAQAGANNTNTSTRGATATESVLDSKPEVSNPSQEKVTGDSFRRSLAVDGKAVDNDGVTFEIEGDPTNDNGYVVKTTDADGLTSTVGMPMSGMSYQQAYDKALSKAYIGKIGDDNKAHDKANSSGKEVKTKDAKTAKIDNPEKQQAQADLDAAMGELGEIFLSANLFAKKAVPTALNVSDLVPVMTKVMDASFRLGYLTFKENARFVLDTIREKFGDAAADSIQINHLQGAYIGMGKGANSPSEVISIDSIEKITEDYLPDGWSQVSKDGLSTNDDPIYGGIVDKQIKSGEWFFIANNDNVSNQEGFSSRASAFNALESAVSNIKGDENVSTTTGNLESSGQRGNDSLQAPVQRSGKQDRQGTGEGRKQTGEAGVDVSKRDSVPANRPVIEGKGGDTINQGENSGAGVSTTGSVERGGGRKSGEYGQSNDDRQTTSKSNDVYAKKNSLAAKVRLQKKAEGIKSKAADIDNIRETLPLLIPEQQDDVFHAETRFKDHDGFMITNGTGTGKTYSGLGIIKRFSRAGKKNIVIVAPNAKVINDWIDSGKGFQLDISKLKNTTDKGSGIVVASYENFRENSELLKRDYDLLVFDESHKLNSNKSGVKTKAQTAMRMAANLYGHDLAKANAIHNDKLIAHKEKISKEVERLNKKHGESHKNIELAKEKYHKEGIRLDAIINKERDKIKAKKKSKVLFLSASPFAYHKSLQYADGFLFESGEHIPKTGHEETGYNVATGFDSYLQSTFGYQMRTGLLNQPDAEVDTSLAEKNANQEFKDSGALIGRKLTVEPDYSREFILVDDSIGNKIDEGIKYLWDNHEQYSGFSEQLNKRFDYLNRLRLLEALKAHHAVDRIKKHLSLGRKVVVFHDYKKGQSAHPFQFSPGERVSASDIHKFRQDRPDLVNLNLAGLGNVISTLTSEFPDALVFNGDTSAADKLLFPKIFNDDNSGKNLIIVLRAAGKEGISLHDTTGKHQRVLIDMGLPIKPTDSIQTEGRIYRTGVKTNAPIEYFSTGLNYESQAFAQAIATRSSTAENLAMGHGARDLLNAFVSGYIEPNNQDPSSSQGVGGKEGDRYQNEVTPLDQAKLEYAKQQKNRKTRANREGKDYYATPEPVGLAMVQWANLNPNDSALEPSAGHGAIARYFPDATNNTFIEPSYNLAPQLGLLGNGKVNNDQFEDLNIINKYDAVIMNPPFGSAGSTAIKHIDKAFKHLKDGGRIIAIVPKGAMDKKLDAFIDGTKDAYTVANIELPSNIFKKAGTGVSTQIAIIDKVPAKWRKDGAVLPNHRWLDYRTYDNLNEVFDVLNDISMPERITKPEENAKFSKESTNSFAKRIKEELNLKAFHVLESERTGDIELSSLIVNKGDQQTGKGSKAMEALISFADANNKRVVLSPGLPNDNHGTTSRARLVKFYKRFGFIESKGRNIDYALGAGKMYRNPQSKFSKSPNKTGSTTKQIESLLPRRASKMLGKGLEVVQSVSDLPKHLRKKGNALYHSAWHGTPHNFDKFSTDNIGTGEGAQAYGYGLYFAGSRDIAEFYRAELSIDDDVIEVNGQFYYKTGVRWRNANQAEYAKDSIDLALDIFSENDFDYEKSIISIKKKITEIKKKEKVDFIKDELIGVGYNEYTEQEINDAIDVIKSNPNMELKGAGKLYNVELAPSQDEYLLWDKDIDSQSDKIHDAIISGSKKLRASLEKYRKSLLDKYGDHKNVVANTTADEGDNVRRLNKLTTIAESINISSLNLEDGESLYKDLVSKLDSDKAASEYLHSLGIRGIKYLDGSSRGKGEGNYNYVVFNDNDVSITEKFSKDLAGVEGLYDPKTNKTYLIADMLNKDNVNAVVAHELLHYSLANNPKLKAQLESSRAGLKDIFNKVKAGKYKGRYKKIYDEAMQRVKDADTPMRDEYEEFLAYSVSLFNKKPNSLPGKLKQLIQKLVAMVKTTLLRYGVNVNKLTPADLSALAMQATGIKSGSLDSSGEIAMARNAPKFSKASDSKGSDALDSFKKKSGLGAKKTLADTIKNIINNGLKANVQAIKGRWNDVKPLLEQGVFDKFLGIKLAEKEILGDVAHSQAGYIGARFSTGSSSTMSALLQFGAPKWIDGVIQKKPDSKSFAEILQPVKDDLENFTAWMVARRADRLFREGKENNFTRPEIDSALKLKKDSYQGVADNIAELNKSVLDLAQESGLIDANSRRMFESNDYIPFYRLVEGQSKSPSSKKGLSHQSSGIRMLKGGESPMSNPLGNMMQNWAHLIDASMKNSALDKTLNNLDGSRFIEKVPKVEFKQSIIPKSQIKTLMLDSGLPKQMVDLMPSELTSGIAKMWGMQAPTSPDVVRVMRDGKPEYYKVHDAMLLSSLGAVNQDQLGGVFKSMRYMKRLLTSAITAEPTFMARNFIRDSMHSWTIAEEKGFKIGVDSFHGAVKSFKEEGGFVDMMFAGASFQGGYGNYNNPELARESMDAALRRRGIKDVRGFKESIIDTPKKYYDMYRSYGDAIENASREAILENAKKAGKSKAEYLFESKDIMDFSMQGSFTLIRAMSDMLPFFNARLVGLYRLAKAGKTAEARQLILTKGLSIAAMSLALLAINSDNDDYEELEDWDKDQYWHFFAGEQHFRIPKPFELGLVFGTIPERSARLLIGKDTLTEFSKRMAHGASDTLAFNPVPQMFKPFVEVYANENMFTGRPIEGMADEGKLPSARYNAFTSETMRLLSSLLPEGLGASPKRLEHLMRGYLGSLGMYGLGVSDMMVRSLSGMPQMPESRLDRMPVVKAFYQEKPTMHTKYGTQFYEMLKEVNQIHRTVNAYRKEGDSEKANKLINDNIDKLRTRKQLNKTSKSLSGLRKRIDAIYRSDLSSSEKRQRIDSLMQQSNERARQVVQRTHEYFN